MRPIPGSIVAMVVALGVVALAGCGGDNGSTSETAAPAVPFKVGVAGAMTGQYAAYGASQRAGAEIAVAELNAAGGVNGGAAAIAVADDRGDPDEAAVVARSYIDDAEIVVVDGHQLSGATMTAGATYEAAGLPMISPSATGPDIGALGAYVWRICPTDAMQGKELADYSVATLGKQRIAVMYATTDYGRGLAAAYESGVAAGDGTIVGKEPYALGDTDFTAQLKKLGAADPDLLFLSGYYSEGWRIAQQARKLGLDVQMLGSDGFASDELPKLGGEGVEGMLVSTFFDHSSGDPAVQKFVEAYRARFEGGNPDWFAATSYDAIMLAAQAARNAGSNGRDAINKALTEIGTYEGISGPITFDGNGDVIKPLTIVVVKDGALATAPSQPKATQ